MFIWHYHSLRIQAYRGLIYTLMLPRRHAFALPLPKMFDDMMLREKVMKRGVMKRLNINT